MKYINNFLYNKAMNILIYKIFMYLCIINACVNSTHSKGYGSGYMYEDFSTKLLKLDIYEFPMPPYRVINPERLFKVPELSPIRDFNLLKPGRGFTTNSIIEREFYDETDCIRNCNDWCMGYTYTNPMCLEFFDTTDLINPSQTRCICGNLKYICKIKNSVLPNKLLYLEHLEIRYIPLIENCLNVEKSLNNWNSTTDGRKVINKSFFNCLRYARKFNPGFTCKTASEIAVANAFCEKNNANIDKILSTNINV